MKMENRSHRPEPSPRHDVVNIESVSVWYTKLPWNQIW